MRRTLVLLATLLAASLLGVRPSQAQFATCDHAYVASFDVPAYGTSPAWSAGTIECVPYFDFSFTTPHGTRHIRGVGDVNVDRLIRPGAIDAIRQGAERAAQRMEALGEYSIDNTTILITFSTSDPISTERKEGGASAWTLPSDASAPKECHVTLFLMSDHSLEEMQYATAHELFHCVELASLSEAQNNTAAGYGLWWIEGAAELFAAAAIGEQERWNNAAAFDEAVRNERPLYAMTYEASVYFYWQHQREGFGALMPFLRGMADNPSESAQRAAIRRMTPDHKLLEFAEAYDDRTIVYPSGRALRSGSRIDGEVWSVSATSTQRRTIKPFVIMPGWTDYACGNWENNVSDVNVAARDERASSWSDWPGATNARDTGGARYRSIAFHSGDENAELRLRTSRTASCEPCLASTAIDRCVVGVWRQTGGGPLEYLRRNGVPITMANQDQLELTMRDDGTFSTNAIRTEMQTETTDSHGHRLRGSGRGATSAVHGRWSAEGGALRGCVDSGGSPRGVTTLEAEGHSRSMPWSGSAAGTSGGTNYSCSDATFTTSSPTRYGDMTYTFTRVSPPPRD